MWRLRKRNPGKVEVTNSELRRAIMYEIGTDQTTYTRNRKALILIGWLRSGSSKQRVRFTDEDL